MYKVNHAPWILNKHLFIDSSKNECFKMNNNKTHAGSECVWEGWKTDLKALGTSLVVQWLRLWAPNAGGPGSIPGQGTRSHMPQLRPHMLQLKILHMATKIPCAATKTHQTNKQINKY